MKWRPDPLGCLALLLLFCIYWIDYLLHLLFRPLWLLWEWARTMGRCLDNPLPSDEDWERGLGDFRTIYPWDSWDGDEGEHKPPPEEKDQ